MARADCLHHRTWSQGTIYGATDSQGGPAMYGLGGLLIQYDDALTTVKAEILTVH